MLTEKDRELIKEAERLSYTEWDKAFCLAEEAETEEAETRLKDIGRLLYHKEEYYAGLL